MMKQRIWKKDIIYNQKGLSRYQIVSDDGYTIDASIGSKQGFPGSNMVTVFMPKYGGYILNTPKFFKNKTDVNNFIQFAKAQIDKKKYGLKVPFYK